MKENITDALVIDDGTAVGFIPPAATSERTGGIRADPAANEHGLALRIREGKLYAQLPMDESLSAQNNPADAAATGSRITTKSSALVRTTETAPLVQMYPDTGSNILPKVWIAASQNGTPSLDNICPLQTVNRIQLIQTGINLLCPKPGGQSRTSKGVTFSVDETGAFTVQGTATEDADCGTRFGYADFKGSGTLTYSVLPHGVDKSTMRICLIATGGEPYFDLGNSNKATYATNFKGKSVTPFVRVYAGKTVDITFYPMLCVGNSSPSHFEKGTQQVFIVTLPVPSYGGYIDWKRGKYVQTYGHWQLNGSELWRYEASSKLYWTPRQGRKVGFGIEMRCSHFKRVMDGGPAIGCFRSGAGTNIMFNYDNGTGGTAVWAAYVADQKAKGTPVEVCYELEKPVEYDLVLPTIPALAGVNTVYSDGWQLQVTYQANSSHWVDRILTRLEALER